jgi:hypothetical protein
LRILSTDTSAGGGSGPSGNNHESLNQMLSEKMPNYTMSDLGWWDPFYSEADYAKECELLDDFAIALQMILGILSFSSLLLKRNWELPKRSKRIFTLDISKQAGQAFWAHVLNVMLAVYLHLEVNKGNGCEWYLISFTSDIFIVVPITLCMHQLVQIFAKRHKIIVLQSGVYLDLHDAQYIFRYTYKELDRHINYKIYFI